MADVSKKSIEEVIEDKGTLKIIYLNCFFYMRILGSELVFIVYPHTIALMNWSTLWAILFFFMVITLGIDSTVSSLLFLFQSKKKHEFSLVVLNQ